MVEGRFISGKEAQEFPGLITPAEPAASVLTDDRACIQTDSRQLRHESGVNASLNRDLIVGCYDHLHHLLCPQ